jgi:hypothetical protein
MRHPSISPYGPFKVRDGSVFFGIQNEREWLIFCRDILSWADLPALGAHTETVRAEFTAAPFIATGPTDVPT